MLIEVRVDADVIASKPVTKKTDENAEENKKKK